MRFILYDQNYGNHVDANAIQVCDGFRFQYNFASFLFGDGFTNAHIIRNDINKMFDMGKKPSITIVFGANCGTNFYKDFPYVEMVTKHHEGGGSPIYNKFPIFYHEDYLQRILSFLTWLSVELSSVIHKVDYIIIGGINRTTAELRVPAQDFTTTSDIPSAYALAAKKWLDLGYNYDDVVGACDILLYYYHISFGNTMKLSALIGGKNGFPCIDKTGKVCEPNKRPIINDDIISSAKKYNNMGLMATALTNEGGTPANFVSSGLPMYYQLSFATYNDSPTAKMFEGAILNAQKNNGQSIELTWKVSVQFAEIIKEFQK